MSGFVLLQNREFNFPHSKYCCRRDVRPFYQPPSVCTLLEMAKRVPVLPMGINLFGCCCFYGKKCFLFPPSRWSLQQRGDNNIEEGENAIVDIAIAILDQSITIIVYSAIVICPRSQVTPNHIIKQRQSYVV